MPHDRGQNERHTLIRTINVKPPPGLADPECVNRMQLAQAKVREQDGFGAALLRELLDIPVVMDLIQQESDWLAEQIRDCVRIRAGWYEESLRAMIGEPPLDEEVWVRTFRSK